MNFFPRNPQFDDRSGPESRLAARGTATENVLERIAQGSAGGLGFAWVFAGSIDLLDIDLLAIDLLAIDLLERSALGLGVRTCLAARACVPAAL